MPRRGRGVSGRIALNLRRHSKLGVHHDPVPFELDQSRSRGPQIQPQVQNNAERNGEYEIADPGKLAFRRLQ
jgi:hypothetical protein